MSGIYLNSWQSPLGGITLGSDGEALTGLWFEGQKYFGSGSIEAGEARELPVFRETKRWLTMYFDGKRPDFTPPLNPQGSPFRLAVWTILREIPYGETVSYGDVASKMAARTGKTGMSAQAVGGAVAHNPISLIIPCHRVVGADGSLTGYAGGVDKKRALLTLEGADMTGLYVPKRGTAL